MIAIIILTYNRPVEFKRALLSAIMQKKVKYHVFIFDNHSKVKLDKILKSLSINNMTYIRHSKNIGFGNNLKYATNYVISRGYKYAFFLGDDDAIAYPEALYDLYLLIKKQKAVHIVRGGFVFFVKQISNLTQIFLHKKTPYKKTYFLEIDKAIKHNITFYSGILFKTKFFDTNLCIDSDLVSPLVLPLFKILKTNKFDYLPKITIYCSTEHDQLATRIYNDKISNDEALMYCAKKIGENIEVRPSIFELINYKIYSNNPRYIEKYYIRCLSNYKNLKKIPFIAIYLLPRKILIILKKIYKLLVGIKTKHTINQKFKYLRIT